ncbi:MAG: N-acetylmuramoyl-L-alanine amidase [Burkholderiaceae bacterium]
MSPVSTSLHLAQRSIRRLVIHCSATVNGDDLFRGTPGKRDFRTPLELIDAWHAERGFNRQAAARSLNNPNLRAIGYHFLIYRSGVVVTGRGIDEVGAHAAGANTDSLGICLVGTDQYTREQWHGLKGCVEALLKRYPLAVVVGHRDLSPDRNGDGRITPNEFTKTCPGFDVSAWLKGGMAPLAAHLAAKGAA